ncbi:hypothetical protein HMPREF1624_05721 [Sporothrix schenckii ATCC 58251]|uniref:Major facilitator superfamily (MFS) profile domain-containing protein n=1 Tax=Sporothrix schenckii (strain ATCC 58251 / de Perez 2211183) TaxID=1391915 RepID=U7PSW6_SPOS1|nr:hypothetical protein HMPREF1624_05721 [Sporothrix schenckii ATCC 58251]
MDTKKEAHNDMHLPDDAHMADVSAEAQAATAKEHSMTLWRGIKTYPHAIGWSVLFSTAIIMEGYDVVLMGSFFAYPAFKDRYGDLQPDGTRALSAAWQAGLTNGMNCGQILGLMATGIVTERFGYRKTMLAALSSVVAFIFILFFAPNKPALIAGEILMGIPLGVFQTVTVTYASEVCPVVLRAYLTTYVNLCWVIGQIVGSSVLRGLLSRTDEWAYRIPFAVQWVWPVPLIVAVFLAPESPWWLVRRGRLAEATASLRRLASGPGDDLTETVSMMVHTTALEAQLCEGTSYLSCFSKANLRRTEISCLTWAVQNLCGAGLMGYSTYFYENAGLATDKSFDMSLAQYGIGFFGTLFSWVLMSHFGRRTLYVGGLFTLCVLLLIVGFISLAPGASTILINADGTTQSANIATAWATGSMLLVYTFVYDSTVGPVCYSLVSEMPATRVRNKTIVLARNLYNIFSIVNGVVIPYMLNPTAWHWAGKAGFFWGGLCFCSTVWAYFRLPEPRGRTFSELDVLFGKGISARKFASTDVDVFGEEAPKVAAVVYYKE